MIVSHSKRVQVGLRVYILVRSCRINNININSRKKKTSIMTMTTSSSCWLKKTLYNSYQTLSTNRIGGSWIFSDKLNRCFINWIKLLLEGISFDKHDNIIFLSFYLFFYHTLFCFKLFFRSYVLCCVWFLEMLFNFI